MYEDGDDKRQIDEYHQPLSITQQNRSYDDATEEDAITSRSIDSTLVSVQTNRNNNNNNNNINNYNNNKRRIVNPSSSSSSSVPHIADNILLRDEDEKSTTSTGSGRPRENSTTNSEIMSLMAPNSDILTTNSVRQEEEELVNDVNERSHPSIDEDGVKHRSSILSAVSTPLGRSDKHIEDSFAALKRSVHSFSSSSLAAVNGSTTPTQHPSSTTAAAKTTNATDSNHINNIPITATTLGLSTTQAKEQLTSDLKHCIDGLNRDLGSFIHLLCHTILDNFVTKPLSGGLNILILILSLLCLITACVLKWCHIPYKSIDRLEAIRVLVECLLVLISIVVVCAVNMERFIRKKKVYVRLLKLRFREMLKNGFEFSIKRKNGNIFEGINMIPYRLVFVYRDNKWTKLPHILLVSGDYVYSPLPQKDFVSNDIRYRSTSRDCFFIIEETPMCTLLRNYSPNLHSSQDKVPLYSKLDYFSRIFSVVSVVSFFIVLVVNIIRVAARFGNNDWVLLLLMQPSYVTLLLLPVGGPLAWLINNVIVKARIASVFTILTEKSRREEFKDIQPETKHNPIHIPLHSLIRNFFRILLHKTLSYDSVLALGSVTALCFVNKNGVLADLLFTPEKLLLMKTVDQFDDEMQPDVAEDEYIADDGVNAEYHEEGYVPEDAGFNEKYIVDTYNENEYPGDIFDGDQEMNEYVVEQVDETHSAHNDEFRRDNEDVSDQERGADESQMEQLSYLEEGINDEVDNGSQINSPVDSVSVADQNVEEARDIDQNCNIRVESEYDITVCHQHFDEEHYVTDHLTRIDEAPLSPTHSEYSRTKFETPNYVTLDLMFNRETTDERDVIQFEDPEWRRHMDCLKPLGLNFLITGSSKLPDFDQVEGMIDAKSHLWKKYVYLLGKEIGFSDDVLESFSFRKRIHTQREKREMSSVIVEYEGAGIQIHSFGHPDLLLDYCSDCWDGTDIKPMTPSARRHVHDTYMQWSKRRDLYVLALAYKPIDDTRYSSLLASHQNEDVINIRDADSSSVDVNGDAGTNAATDVDADAGVKTESINQEVFQTKTTAQQFNAMQCGQIFLGMAAFRQQPKTNLPDFIRDLEDDSGIRFIFFSTHNSQKTKAFGAKLGMETDWNSCISLTERDVDLDESDLRAKLPHGINDIREHIKNTDNVPLLVSLFSDATPETTTQMVSILQENHEVVCCVGSSIAVTNIPMYTQSNVAIAVDPSSEQHMSDAKYNSEAKVQEQQEENDFQEDYSSLFSFPTAFHIKANPQNEQLTPTFPILFHLIKEGRRNIVNLKQALLFLMCANLCLWTIQILSQLLFLPSTLFTGVQSLWMMFIIIPLFSLSLMGSPMEPNIMDTISSKNILNKGKSFRLFMNNYLRFLIPIPMAFVVYVWTLFSMRPAVGVNWKIFGTGVRDSTNLYRSYEFLAAVTYAQNVTLFVVVYYFTFISVGFIHRVYSIFTVRIYRNIVWMFMIPFIIILQFIFSFVACISVQRYVSPVKFPHYPFYAYLIVLLPAPIIIVLDELAKIRLRKKYFTHQKRLKLQFGTKLGMYSPK